MPFKIHSVLSRRQSMAVMLLILITGICLSGYYVMLPVRELANRTVTDDAYYYFQTARNVASGQGSTSSGGIVHNGYHPLWLLTSAFFYWITPGSPGPFVPIRLILTFGILCSALSAVVVYRVARRLGCVRLTALLAAGLFHLNPFMIRLTVSGLEAPLNGLLLGGLLLSFLRILEHAKRPKRDYLLFGLLMGLTYLVRTDNIFLIAFLWFMLIVRHRAVSGIIGRLMMVGCLALGVALPWIIWNAVTFGDLIQGSASALPVVRHRAFLVKFPEAGALGVFGWRLALAVSWIPAVFWSTGLGLLWHAMLALIIVLLWFDVKTGRSRERRLRGSRIIGFILRWGLLLVMFPAWFLGRQYLDQWSVRDWLLLLIFAILTGLSGELLLRAGSAAARRLSEKLQCLFPLLAAVLVLGVIHKGLRLATREWYFVPSDLLLALAWALMVQYIFRFLGKQLPMIGLRRTAITVVVLCTAVCGAYFARKYIGHIRQPLNPYTWELMEAASALKPRLEAGESVGATDSGLIGYLADVPIVNLDGVVNPGAAEAIKRGELLQYCRRVGLRFVLITPRMVTPAILGEEAMRNLRPCEPLGSEGYFIEEK